MRVVGVDPGLGRCGYAVVDQHAGRPEAVTYGHVATRGEEVAPRLAQLAGRFREVVAGTRPDCLAIERLFVNANVRTAMAVGQASGVILLVAAEHGLPVTSYTPSQVKRAMAGVGSAPKEQVAYMVRAALGLAAVPTPADTADALAVALCHLHHLGMHAAGGQAAGAIGAAPEAAWLARAAPTSPGLGRPAARDGRR
jgi:crossover junction endodeoxyribonuclease RuvC